MEDHQHKRYQAAIEIYGADAVEKARNSKILVVGAGGIGCELLKNLVLSGFEQIEVIDLDTIDVSNLNRQFLFRKQHVGRAKSEIARESALQFNHHVQIHAHVGSIFESQYDTEYFGQFAMVLNALDNVGARRHVNRMCLAAGIPLIESGTAGYLGQTQIIRKGITECYECSPKATPKVYPTCTIRNTPSAPIHCIVWAKHLFVLLYGVAADTDEITQFEHHPQASIIGEDKAITIFNKVYETDINTLLGMEELWKARTPPTPINYETASRVDGSSSSSSSSSGGGDGNEQQQQQQQQQQQREESAAASKHPDQKVLSVKDYAKMFVESVERLSIRLHQEHSGGSIEWDKDDEDALQFVVAASNLRSYCFGIPMSSLFDIKAMAGNIIPAIATTNAIIAGLIVTTAYRILSGHADDVKCVYALRYPSRRRILLCSAPDTPNPNCYVCQLGVVQVKLNTKTTTFKQFLETVLKTELNFKEPSISLDSNIIYEEGEDAVDMSAQLSKTLETLHITNAAQLHVEDFLQDLNVYVHIVHTEEDLDPTGYVVTQQHSTTGSSNDGMQVVPMDSTATTTSTAAMNDSDELVRQKRKREAEESQVVSSNQKLKADVQASQEDAIEIDDDEDELILLD